MNKSAFTLLEIIIAILIIGIMSVIIIPNITGRNARFEREAFIADFERLVQLAWQKALTENVLHRVYVHMEKKIITIEKQVKTDKTLFTSLTDVYVNTEIEIPQQLKLKQFFIEGKDELSRFSKRETKDVWFFAFPDGTLQSVVINLLDMKDKKNNKPRQVGLMLHPFSAQFIVYDEYKKP